MPALLGSRIWFPRIRERFVVPRIFTKDALERRLRTEVEQQANLEVCRTQIVEQLCTANLRRLLLRLHLNDETVVDEHVEALVRQLVSLIEDRHADFARHVMASRAQLTF